MQARYALGKYPEEVREAHDHGYFHIHDLSFGLAGYCAGWSLRDLLLEGFNLPGRSCAGPARHFDAAMAPETARSLRRGEADVELVTGPHLGAFNDRTSLPELAECTAAAAAACLVGRYFADRGRN